MNRMAEKTVRGTMMVLIICTGMAMAQDPTIDWFTIDGGGQMSSTGGGFELAGTIGQADASSFEMPMTGGGFELVGGFWTGASVALVGDLDGDGDVDKADYAQVERCLDGPDNPVPPECQDADLDGDGDVDLADAGILFNNLTPTGACCQLDGTCSVVTLAECNAAGGTYQGDGFACVPDPCGQGTGACCIGEFCVEAPQAVCEGEGGTYQGDGTVCTPNPCL